MFEWDLYLRGLAVMALLALGTWFLSLFKGDVSIVVGLDLRLVAGGP
ncbi:hypothetical protein [Nitrosococcus halophilus]|nr:hypothetical protein [Nitrosococcus halophilus]